MTEQSIIKQIGKPAEIDLRKPKAIGSTGFYLKSFKTKNSETETLKIESKCNFEKRTGGILLRANYSNKLTAIPIPNENIIGISLKRGKESINPFFLSPMWILLKLGVSILKARYFRFWLHEYSIDQMELNIETNEYEMEFIANGYLFERQLSFFENLNCGNKLKTERKAST
ncbi:hypothetical protein [Tenacibaculum soleae]|uniref:Uncharacterized protein n=1 Tax=Tenacibaculum soleae TaxID=447689 RepID=A0A1B9XWG4_9FLAO|nr:hypothetical protein [Tenacibaculum soleae]MDO6813982.1 hypothetical protein [Tenacibaculum soleae]OCK41846.1 hypothetical protein BA195_13440 [Tenacibaculum soleae]